MPTPPYLYRNSYSLDLLKICFRHAKAMLYDVRKAYLDEENDTGTIRKEQPSQLRQTEVMQGDIEIIALKCCGKAIKVLLLPCF